MKTIKLLLFFSLLGIGCNVNIKRENSPTDKAAMDSIATTFYTLAEKMDTVGLRNYFDTTGSYSIVEQWIINYDRNYGAIKKWEIYSTETSYEKNETQEIILADVKSRVEFPGFEAFETLVLKKSKNARPQILGYSKAEKPE